MSDAAIPKTFHFVYGLRRQTEPFHLLHYLCLESCRQVNHPDRIRVYHHYEPWGEYWDMIRPHVELVRVPRPEFLRRYRYEDRFVARYRYAHESDFIRLEVLLEHGGVYADIDTLFVRPVPDALFHQAFVLGREDDITDMSTGQVKPSLCNAFIMAAPGAEFARIWRREMEAAFDGSWSNHSTLLPWKLAEAHPGLIHVEPARTFYPYMWTREDFRRLFELNDRLKEGAASIHLWAHLWWTERRRDFSDFHHGHITEDEIRSRDTTFNVLARPFLPPQRPRLPWTRRLRYAAARVAARVRNPG